MDDIQLRDTVHRLMDLLDRIAILQSEAETLKALLRLDAPRGRTKVGELTLSVTANRRFTGEVARHRLSPDRYAGICIPKPDAATARRVLTQDEYDDCCQEGEAVVRIG